jgi:1L-myo-inositol 1-phosphate cytidylyltransferase
VKPVDTAVILAAGAGTRLRTAAESKPLCVVAGKTLLDHALERLAAAGITRAIVVTGYRAAAIEAHIAARDWPLTVETVRTRDWRLPNGVSALAAVDALAGVPTLLAMCDHLVEPALYARMAAAGPGPGLRLGVDRRLSHPWVDPEDVTFVATAGARIVAIGKGMAPHDAFDTGVFAVGAAFFTALAKLDAPSITDAVRALAMRGVAEVVECSDLTWIDVDDPKALAAAEDWASHAMA